MTFFKTQNILISIGIIGLPFFMKLNIFDYRRKNFN